MAQEHAGMWYQAQAMKLKVFEFHGNTMSSKMDYYVGDINYVMEKRDFIKQLFPVKSGKVMMLWTGVIQAKHVLRKGFHARGEEPDETLQVRETNGLNDIEYYGTVTRNII
ncbi:hypothetical protein CHS0354_008736 [Potamilus streckersoni]|uniref:Uncharacterized protein n=1 Tax=Potamilus streckersoni TaxID=2493646 RepID=A0AAE0WDQ2_9BIVA|nr:hypothetical protein CHS0354_008736 [Potamilus streckersoni]